MPPSRTRPLGARKILVVDDQPSIRGVLERALSDAGADVCTAADGRTALALTEANSPELILLDLVMPGTNGWQVIEALNASPETARIPVVLETSAETFASFDRAKREGVAAFISKPFRLAEVIEICRRVLAGARPLQGRRSDEEWTASVEIRDTHGNVVTGGHLLDITTSGAQVQMDEPPPLGQWLTLTFPCESGVETVSGQVRWVTRSVDAYHAGLLLRRGPSDPDRL